MIKLKNILLEMASDINFGMHIMLVHTSSNVKNIIFDRQSLVPRWNDGSSSMGSSDKTVSKGVVKIIFQSQDLKF
jgi:hypothetical protein